MKLGLPCLQALNHSHNFGQQCIFDYLLGIYRLSITTQNRGACKNQFQMVELKRSAQSTNKLTYIKRIDTKHRYKSIINNKKLDQSQLQLINYSYFPRIKFQTLQFHIYFFLDELIRYLQNLKIRTMSNTKMSKTKHIFIFGHTSINTMSAFFPSDNSG